MLEYGEGTHPAINAHIKNMPRFQPKAKRKDEPQVVAAVMPAWMIDAKT